jgi:23S rRNA (guanosine2251-2'-O)-methyltransferase
MAAPMAKNTRPGRKTGKPGRGASPPRPGKEPKQRKGPAGGRRDDSRNSSPKAPYQRPERGDSRPSSARGPQAGRTPSSEESTRGYDRAPARSGTRPSYERPSSRPPGRSTTEETAAQYGRQSEAPSYGGGGRGRSQATGRASAASRSHSGPRESGYNRQSPPRQQYSSEPRPTAEAPRRPAARPGTAPEVVARPQREVTEPVIVARPDNIVPDDIVWGRRTVIENLRSGQAINRIYLLTTAEGLNREFFHLAKEHNVPLVRCDKSRLDILSQGGNHQGLVAQLSTRTYLSPNQIQEEFQEKGGLLLALSGIQDPGNLGAALRTAEAAGVRQILLSSEQSCGLTATVSKTSAGADSWLDIGRSPNLKKELSNFKDQGVQVVVTVPRSNVELYQVDFTKPTVIVVGSEGWGLEPNLVKMATHQVTIPMQGKVESLNVSAATAVVLYEVVRQRIQAKAGQSSSEV